MLPGFRFLFAAIVLSMSILVFGLGAAALLRAAHEEFASTPAWHATPEAVFAQQTETTGPVLAMLRVEPPAAEEKAPDQAATAVKPADQPATTAASAEPEATAKPAEPEVAATPAKPEATAIPAEPERTAALQPENPSQAETAKPDMPVAESPAQPEAAPAPAVAPAADETKMATSASEEVSSPASEAAPAAPEQAGPPASADADIASTKIATLGGPPSPSKRRRRRNPSSQGMSGASSGSAWKHTERPGITGWRCGHASCSNCPAAEPDPFGQQFAAAPRR